MENAPWKDVEGDDSNYKDDPNPYLLHLDIKNENSKFHAYLQRRELNHFSLPWPRAPARWRMGLKLPDTKDCRLWPGEAEL